MVKAETRLSDKINMNAVQYITKKRVSVQQAIVTFSASQKVLRFNTKMVHLLGLDKWESVVAGYDRKSKIIVLKKADPEEIGAVACRYPTGNDKNAKVIGIGHVAASFGLDMKKNWRAEKNGDIILLEAIEDINE